MKKFLLVTRLRQEHLGGQYEIDKFFNGISINGTIIPLDEESSLPLAVRTIGDWKEGRVTNPLMFLRSDTSVIKFAYPRDIFSDESMFKPITDDYTLFDQSIDATNKKYTTAYFGQSMLSKFKYYSEQAKRRTSEHIACNYGIHQHPHNEAHILGGLLDIEYIAISSRNTTKKSVAK
jgi:hypothetical protein